MQEAGARGLWARSNDRCACRDRASGSPSLLSPPLAGTQISARGERTELSPRGSQTGLHDTVTAHAWMDEAPRPYSKRERELITELFGEDDESTEKCEASTSGRPSKLARTPGAQRDTRGIEGLCLVRDFLDHAQQERLLRSLTESGFLTAVGEKATNQAMRFFGSAPLPAWLGDLADRVQAAALPHWPRELAARTPFCNQCIVNSYSPGQGITPHVDLVSFADGIVSVSLRSPTVMDFRSCETGELTEVLLFPGDLLLMCGPARYEYTHGIAPRTEDVWDGEAHPRGHRVSITLRRMRDDVHMLTEPAAAAAACEEEKGSDG